MLKNNIFKHNVYFDLLDDIVNKYNNTVIEALKWNQLTLRLILMLNTMKILMEKVLNSKLVIMLGFQNKKTFLLNDALKIGQKFLLLANLKIQFRGHTLLVTWMVNQLLEVFMKQNCKIISQEKFRIEKVLKRKGDKLYGKGMIVVLIVGLTKKTFYDNESILS